MQVVATKWLDVMRGEFIEMPGMRLTFAQAKRLWGLDDAACTAFLASLVETGFLRRGQDGSYRRNEMES